MSDEPPFNRGGLIPGGPISTPVRLYPGEEIIDAKGRRRGKVIGNRLVWFPIWLSNLLPRYNRRR